MEHLIPDVWFEGRSQLVLLAIGAVAVLLLGKGADWLVDGASGLAYRMGLSKIIVGATIVSLGTTSPECAVSVMAAWGGDPGLALGNAVGSIIADSGLIFGLGCLLVVLPADRFVLARQGWVQFGSAVLLALICYGAWIVAGPAAAIPRWVGFGLLVLLALYMVQSVKWSRANPESVTAEAHEVGGSAARLVGLILIGLVFVLLASRVMIGSVTELAEVHWKVPSVVIAGTLVAFGTSLPELVIGMASIVKGHREILVGNVIGADILNVLFVVGASASAARLPIVEHDARVPEIALLVHIPAMLLIIVAFRVFIQFAVKRGHFKRWYGVPLIAIYVVYTVLQYVIS
ncbi:MAG: sodium:calcium antiporter [bacterium]|nr:sodium:calcium antiporter [bacterium]